METSASFEARYALQNVGVEILDARTFALRDQSWWLPDCPSVEQNIKLRNLQIFF
jgi:hypothetical protein